jgi:hypothetical protein
MVDHTNDRGMAARRVYCRWAVELGFRVVSDHHQRWGGVGAIVRSAMTDGAVVRRGQKGGLTGGVSCKKEEDGVEEAERAVQGSILKSSQAWLIDRAPFHYHTSVCLLF